MRTADLLDRIIRFLAPAVVIYAFFMITGTITLILGQGQTALDSAIADRISIERRISTLESGYKDMSDQIFWSRIGIGGTGLLLAERALHILRQKKIVEQED